MAKRDVDEYSSAEEQGIEETPEEEKTEDVYSEKGREELMEDGEIEPWEEGFMEGAEGRGELAKCAHCGKILSQSKKNLIEREIDGELYLFCCEECAEKGIGKL